MIRVTTTTDSSGESSLGLLISRSAIGGILMGLANLVPGISGGTLLLAVGIYPRFIRAIGEVTTLRFRKHSLITLGTVMFAAVMAIVFCAGLTKKLVVEHRWIMYSLFIGLTLGGIPVVWRLIGKSTRSFWIASAVGFSGMAVLALAQSAGSQSAVDRSGVVLLFFAGVVGASAMILPGISGGYLLLILGVYVPLLGAISSFVNALRRLELDPMLEIAFSFLLPVGLGVVIGVAVISNLLRFFLRNHEKATLGILLGLLLGAVVGLWPFQRGIEPQPGDRLKNQTIVRSSGGHLLYQESGKLVDPEDYPTAVFFPNITQVGGALAILVGGSVLTIMIGRLAGNKELD